MKKFFGLLIIFIGTIFLVACTPEVDPTYDFKAAAAELERIYSVGDSIDSVKKDLNLRTSLEEHPNVEIRWTSTNTDVISHTGVVTRQVADISVDIKLNLKYKEQTYDRVFRVTVKALEVAPKTFTISLPEHVTADHEGDIVKDTLVTLTVTTPAGKVFKELIVNGVVVAVEGNTYSFTLTKDTIVTVTFEDQAVDTYTLTLPEGVESTHKGNIANGTSVTLTVNVPANHRVSSFRVNDQEQQLNENNEYTFTISRDTEV